MNPAHAAPPTAPPRRISVAEYEGLIESGAIDERAPVELIEGRIVGKMTKGMRHFVAAALIQEAFAAALQSGSGWLVWVEKPVALPGPNSMPEPDVAIVRGRPLDYLDGAPRPSQIGLVVEIADSSLAEDRRRMDLYLAGGVPTCWLLNLVKDRLEIYRPDAAPELLGDADSAELILDGRPIARIAVADLLPRRRAG